MAADEDQVEPVTCSMPIVTGADGHAYVGCDAVVNLLRAIASAARDGADDPDCNLNVMAAAVDIQADALDCRAIAHTTLKAN